MIFLFITEKVITTTETREVRCRVETRAETKAETRAETREETRLNTKVNTKGNTKVETETKVNKDTITETSNKTTVIGDDLGTMTSTMNKLNIAKTLESLSNHSLLKQAQQR